MSVGLVPLTNGKSLCPVSASSITIALRGHPSAASLMRAAASPSGFTTGDWRFSLSEKTLGPIWVQMVEPTHLV